MISMISLGQKVCPTSWLLGGALISLSPKPRGKRFVGTGGSNLNPKPCSVPVAVQSQVMR